MGVGRSLDFFLGRDHLLRDRRLVQICTRINRPGKGGFFVSARHVTPTDAKDP